jgi:hypothetical protein
MAKTKEERQKIAHTIFSQLGGHKFAVMTGARNMVALDSGLQFQLSGGGGYTKNGINFVTVILDPSDTYTIRFQRLRMPNLKTVAEYSDIYADQLRPIFETETGLRTSL